MSVPFAIALVSTLLGAVDRPQVLVVVGAEGTPEYGATFQKWSALWEAAAKKGGAGFVCIGRDATTTPSDHDRFRTFLAEAPRVGSAPLWVVLIGHGTDDGREARFNLRGPDVTAKELAEWLEPVKRPVAVVNCTSASAAFINHLSGPGRVVVTATRSGSESSYARFGGYLAEAIGSPAADLDKDGQVSLLEAFLTAADRVREFYRGEGRLATEHPLLDDNGDKLGSPADWFQGVRAVRRAKDGAAVDGTRAHQWHLIPSARERALPVSVRVRRDELELALATLRDQKDRLSEDEYYDRVEKLMVELARLYAGAKPAP
ncbi:hypothetical protein VT84_24095 [Gemmata sp. SH-PL17]|uniref:hypothetical protein n=1 Tax=Gemmata sp. SH-PL17 TaxID=1630693 RepID=UPI00078C3A79|nr:hypothetical protein [Gemmata sp. SH-PL17]AMV27504.1 hypothetical protein VT84_24095 [Gemmata sp. SH-PL17]